MLHLQIYSPLINTFQMPLVHIFCSTLCKYDSFCAYYNLSGYKNIHLSLKSKSLPQLELQQPPFLNINPRHFLFFRQTSIFNMQFVTCEFISRHSSISTCHFVLLLIYGLVRDIIDSLASCVLGFVGYTTRRLAFARIGILFAQIFSFICAKKIFSFSRKCNAPV